MFDEQEFVAVCRKNDYESGNLKDGIFLVFRKEWENTHEFSTDTFDLLLASVKNNIIKLPQFPDNAVVIIKTLPYSRKSEFMEVPQGPIPN